MLITGHVESDGNEPTAQKGFMNVDRKIGMNIKLFRKISGLSQTECGKYLKVHQAAFCRIESGQQVLKLSDAGKLAILFNVSVGEFLE